MTRGLRNNNPLNIRNGYSRWEGKANKQTDPHFVCFMTKAMGYRAAWKIMYSYLLRMQAAGMAYTLRNIIARWAPPVENDTETYIRTVVGLMPFRLEPDQPLPPPHLKEGKLVMSEVIAAMTCVENGIGMDEVPREEIERGWQLAFNRGYHSG